MRRLVWQRLLRRALIGLKGHQHTCMCDLSSDFFPSFSLLKRWSNKQKCVFCFFGFFELLNYLFHCPGGYSGDSASSVSLIVCSLQSSSVPGSLQRQELDTVALNHIQLDDHSLY